MIQTKVKKLYEILSYKDESKEPYSRATDPRKADAGLWDCEDGGKDVSYSKLFGVC